MTFEADSTQLWYQGATASKTFRMLFQMGDTLSEWTGVTNTITTDIASAATYVDFLPISVTNSIKTSGATSIVSDAGDNSTFEGYIEYTNAAAPLVKPHIRRLIEKTEQTNSDGTIVRIETGRSLKGTYYQISTTGIIFTVTLEGALNSLVGVAGITLAACTTLLAF